MSPSQKLASLFAVSLLLFSLQAKATATEKFYKSNPRHVHQIAQGEAQAVAPSVPGAAASDDNDDARHFEMEKQRREAEKRGVRDSAARLYASCIKAALEKAWHAPQHKELLITKRGIVLNKAGNIIEKKVVTDSSSKAENESVDNVLQSLKFAALPPELDKLELILSFMSDGSMDMVEVREPAERKPNFGPYMADLQRRIKRAWFPPKGNESKRVVVVFKLQSGGELSHLRLDHSSGVAAADEAALTAVKKAAPFRPLPQNAPSSVDIQYTFDYNRYSGGGRGVFQQF